LVLVTNEGNGQHIISGPPVQISLVPIEKIVPTLEDAATLLRVLVRSAGPQLLTTYTTWLTGPRRPGEMDGPAELHIVLVDSGRSEILGTPLEEALRCIRCGACLNVCPVYRRVGGHTYGTVYSGPIGIPLTPIVHGADESTDELSHASSLCGACEEVCPVHIDIPGLILETRRQAVKAGRPHLAVRLAFWLYAFIVSRPWLYRWSLFTGRWLSRLLAHRGRIEHGLGAWTRTRSMPGFAREPFRLRHARRRGARGR
jgi:L-lactate dehydrogenase complex protein LldF